MFGFDDRAVFLHLYDRFFYIYITFIFMVLYILCIFNISPQAVVIVRFKFVSANRHIKVHGVLYGAMWLPYIYISYYTKYWLFL